MLPKTTTTLTPRTLAAYLLTLPEEAQDLPIMIEDWTEGVSEPSQITQAGIIVYEHAPIDSGGRNASYIRKPCVLITVE